LVAVPAGDGVDRIADQRRHRDRGGDRERGCDDGYGDTAPVRSQQGREGTQPAAARTCLS
jgi:hypothetical protein